MKKAVIALAVTATVALSSAAWAGNTGCGLGDLAFGDNDFGNTTLGQSIIVTTNYSFGSQTFGITSGTSNCKQPGTFVKNDRMNEFVASNMDNLAKDIASGQGESLDTLAELMEVAPESRPQLYAKLQSNFGQIYTSDSIEAANVIDNINTVIQ